MAVDVRTPCNKKMSVFPMDEPVTLDCRQMDYPTKVLTSPEDTQRFDSDSTHFIVVQSGEVEVSHGGNVYRL